MSHGCKNSFNKRKKMTTMTKGKKKKMQLFVTWAQKQFQQKKEYNDNSENRRRDKKGRWLCHMDAKIIPTKRKKENDNSEKRK